MGRGRRPKPIVGRMRALRWVSLRSTHPTRAILRAEKTFPPLRSGGRSRHGVRVAIRGGSDRMARYPQTAGFASNVSARQFVGCNKRSALHRPIHAALSIRCLRPVPSLAHAVRGGGLGWGRSEACGAMRCAYCALQILLTCRPPASRPRTCALPFPRANP